MGDAALAILHSMVSAHSDLDDAGEIVTPTPRVKRILSSPRCLPHVAQVYFGLLFACSPWQLYVHLFRHGEGRSNAHHSSLALQCAAHDFMGSILDHLHFNAR